MKPMNVVLRVSILEVVSIDAVNRTVVIKKGDGAEQRAELDDDVAGLADVKAGDHVILTFRGEPGQPRVSAIAKGTAASRRGFCRDLFDQIVGSGETVKRGMAGAEQAARRSLSPGSIRDVRLRYSMDWDGWDRTAPDRLPPY